MNEMEERKWLKKKKKAMMENNFENLYYACKELADIYVNQENYHEALSQYEQCREAANRQGNDTRLGVANRMIGETYCYLNDFENAIKHQKLHLKISCSKNDIVEQQRALATLGRTHFLRAETCDHSEDYKKSEALKTSVKYYLKSLDVCNKLNKEVGNKTLSEMKARLYLNLSLCEESAGELDKSMDFINKAMKLCSDADLNEELCKCYSIKSTLYAKRGNFSKGIACVDQGLQIASRLSSKKDIGTELLCLKAEHLIDINDYQTAKRVMVKAYKLKVPLKNEFEEVIKKLKIIVVMCQAENSLLIASQTDYKQRKQLNEKLGDACVALKKYSKAITYYEKMLEYSEQCGMSDKSLIPCYVSLAQTYKDNKQFYQALEYFHKELSLYSENSIEACKTLLNIADIMEAQYDPFDEIWSIYEKAKRIAEKNNDGLLQLTAVKGMKCLAEDRGRIESIDDLTSELNNLLKFETESVEDECDVPDIWDDVSLKDISDIDEEEEDKKRKRHKLTSIPEKKNEKGETPIIPACAKGNIKLVLSLLKSGHSVNAGDALGWTALHEACNYGQVDIVNVLLDYGADINNRGGPFCEGITPLHDAAACGHLEVIDCLLDRGANPLVRTNNGETPLDSLIACRNRVILEEKKELDPDKLAHFWSIVDRLSECLRKAGHTPPVPSTDIVEILESGQQSTNHYLGVIPESNKRSRRSHRDIEDFKKIEKKEEHIDVDYLNSSGAAQDYKHAIDQLRHHKKRQRETEVQYYEISQPPLVENSVDEWLEEDVVYKPKKRYCTETKSINSPIKNIEDKDDWPMNDELPDSTSEYVESNKKVLSPIRNFDEDSDDMIFISDRQTDIVKNTYKPLLLSTSKTKSYQSKLEHQGFSNIKSSSFSADEPISVSLSQPSKKDETVKNINHTIKVRVENRLFLVPIPAAEENINLKWLSTEASRRYQKLEGVNPVLNLTTDDGALLDENDPIDLVYGLHEILGNIVGWSTESLVESYKKSCAESDFVFDERISQFLDVLQATGTLDMSNCLVMSNVLSVVLNVVCRYQNLKILCLSGVALEDNVVKMFSEHLSNMQQLIKLDISSNNISSVGLAYMTCDNKSLTSLESLNISHNPITNKGLEHLRLITQNSTSLRSLFLCNIDIDHDCYDRASELYLDNIEDLDISFNALGRTGVSGFFIRLDPTRLKYLNVRNTGSSTVLRECALFLERSQADCLRSMDVSSLDLDDEDVDLLCSCLESAGNLQNLWLADNPRVTQMCVDRIKHLSVKVVHMAGCRPIDVSQIGTIDLEKMSLTGRGQSNLFKNAPYNVKVLL